jgi:predicted nucleic acid-binding protein
MFVLDTNVVSELRKAGDGRADANVTAWLAAHDAAAFFLSAIAIMELEIGVRRVERRDHEQGALLRAWLDERVLPEFDGRVLPVDAVVALRCARLHVPDPRSDRDALIAATALTHGMTIVSRNVADFRDTGVPLLDPWQAPSG